MLRTKKLAVAGGLFVAVALTSSLAIALWSSTGTGSGRAQSLTAQTVTVTAVTGAADLYPGFADGDVYFTLTNPNPYPVTFTSLDAGTVTSSDTTACPSANVTVDDVASGLSLTVGANATSATLSVADIASMLSTAPDGCQGRTFDVALTLAGSQT